MLTPHLSSGYEEVVITHNHNPLRHHAGVLKTKKNMQMICFPVLTILSQVYQQVLLNYGIYVSYAYSMLMRATGYMF